MRVFDNPEEAFDIRRQLIINAKEEILMSYYGLANEVRPMNILRLLKEASDRGVKVKLLLDD
jgi:phosphatidylserine/phosphatidylglycerophosphate/cardiolipin synthase-like enzyme